MSVKSNIIRSFLFLFRSTAHLRVRGFIYLLSLYRTDTYKDNLRVCVALLYCAFCALGNLSGYKLVSLINVRSALRAELAARSHIPLISLKIS